jgi:hypothetical protein
MAIEIKNQNAPFQTIEAVEIEKLRMAFQVKRYQGFSSNTAQIKVWNIAEKTRSKLNYFYDNITLVAGYESPNNKSVVFNGITTFVNHKYTIPDIISTFECNCGETLLANKPISFSVSNQIPIKSIFQIVAGKFNLPIDFLFDIPNIKYKKCFSFSGSAGFALDGLCNKVNASWNIFGNRIIIVPRFSASTEGPIPFEINENTGMIGYPERSSYRSRYLENGGFSAGYKVKTVLLPEISPGRLVKVKSKTINLNQNFYVVTATHTGDTHGEIWQSEFELMQQGAK